MSARAVHVRIRRLIVDEPLHGEAAQWSEAIGRALHAQLTRETVAGDGPMPVDRHGREAVAQHVARRVADAAPTTLAPTSGGRRAGA